LTTLMEAPVSINALTRFSSPLGRHNNTSNVNCLDPSANWVTDPLEGGGNVTNLGGRQTHGFVAFPFAACLPLGLVQPSRSGPHDGGVAFDIFFLLDNQVEGVCGPGEHESRLPYPIPMVA
jgi:hypothetical protein